MTTLTPTCAEAMDGANAAALSASMAVAKIGLIMVESSRFITQLPALGMNYINWKISWC
jgi:hypothetical protein